MLQFLVSALLLSSTAAKPTLEANVTLGCELNGDEITSAIAWSMDSPVDMNKYKVEKNSGFYVNNEKKQPFNWCKDSPNKVFCDKKIGWNDTISIEDIKPENPFGPVLDLRWEGFLSLKYNPISWSIYGSGSISVLTNDSMTIRFNLTRNKESTPVEIVLDERNTDGIQNVSSVIYILDRNGNRTELERRQGPVLDSKLWVHLTINISSTDRNKVQLQLLKYRVNNPIFNEELEGAVSKPVAMSINMINGYHKKHQYTVKYTTSQDNYLRLNLKSGCWHFIYFGPLDVTYPFNDRTETKYMQYRPKVHMGFATYKLILMGNDSTQHDVTIKSNPWYKFFWAIGDILPCYNSRMRNLSGIPLEKVHKVHCTNLISGESFSVTQTPYHVVNRSTIPEPQEVPLPEKDKRSMMENKNWFYLSATLLLLFLIILIATTIKILQHFNICIRNENEPFYRRRGSMLVAMKLESIRKRGNDAASTQRYAATPGAAQEDRNPEDPDYEVIKVAEDTLPSHVPRVPNNLAPPIPPERPAHTFEDPQYDKVNDEGYDNLGLDSGVKKRKTPIKYKEEELDGPEYGNFGPPPDKKITVEEEDPEYGNIVVQIPVKQIVVTADIEAPEYGNFGENVLEVQKKMEEPKVAKYGDIQDDPIYGNF